MTRIQETGDRVLANVERVIVGKHREVRFALVALLCRGHLLIEDVPGTGKTVLAKAIAKSLGCSFRRIQFTPDLLPSDVTGLSIYNQKTQEFEFRPGPIMSQVVLADEINRATPKTQSALLECMEERQATVDGTTWAMPDPFLVIATQNPIEYEGTFALPEAQLDRFMLRIRLGYPQPVEEIVILDEQKRHHPIDELEVVCSVEELREMQDAVREIYVDPSVAEYIVRLVDGDPHPPRRLPRRLAARLDRPVPRRPGARRPARPRLRDPRRRQGPRRVGPGPPADHQDELVDPRRPARPGRRASCSRRPRSRASRPTGAGGSRAIGRTARGRRPRPRATEAWSAAGSSAHGHRRSCDRCSAGSSSCSSGVVLVVAAFSTGLPFLFYLVYLGDPRRRRLVRPDPARPVRPRGRLRGQPAVGPRRRPAPGHVHAPQHEPRPEALARGPQPDLAAGRPARAGRSRWAARTERSWLVRTPLTRRGHFRVEPLQIRTGDPFGFFESSAVGRHGRDRRRLPAHRAPAALAAAGREPRRQPRDAASGRSRRRRSRRRSGRGRRATRSTGSTGSRRPATATSRSRSSTSSRPPTPGSSSTSTAPSRSGAATSRRSRSPSGRPRRSPTRRSSENRAVGITVNAHRLAQLPPDRGGRQHLKIMQLLAAVDGDGDDAARPRRSSRPCPRIRRGMTAVVITPSLERDWVKPLATLRSRGVGCVVVSFDVADVRALRPGRGAASPRPAAGAASIPSPRPPAAQRVGPSATPWPSSTSRSTPPAPPAPSARPSPS